MGIFELKLETGMWTIHGYEFDIAPAPHTEFSAFIGPGDLTAEWGIDWGLTIWSKERQADPAVFPKLPDYVQSVSPKLELKQLPFQVRDWKALRGVRLKLKPKYPRAAWNLFGGEWEAIKAFTLEAVGASEQSLRFKIDGVGFSEAIPELFGAKTAFSVEADVPFTGVHMRTPPNVSDPLSFGLHHLRTYLPDFAHAEPLVEELRTEPDMFHGCHIWFKPT